MSEPGTFRSRSVRVQLELSIAKRFVACVLCGLLAYPCLKTSDALRGEISADSDGESESLP